MATVSARVFSHHQKKDGTYNVKIVVSHRKVRRYLETCHWVSQRQLDRDLKIKVYVMEMLTTLFRAKLTTGLADF
jgi:hypothetical protein